MATREDRRDDQREERLRRELRAAAAVNRELRAQLDGVATPSPTPSASTRHRAGAGGGGARREGTASLWLGSLALASKAGTPTLVRGRDGSRWVIDGGMRRRVGSALLATTLEHHLGPARSVDASQERLPEGPPVEVLEGRSGPPFVVLGGVRRPLRGLPLPHPVTNAETELFRPGPPLDMVAAHVARSRYRRALTGRAQLDLVRREVRRHGPVQGVLALARKARARLRARR